MWFKWLSSLQSGQDLLRNLLLFQNALKAISFSNYLYMLEYTYNEKYTVSMICMGPVHIVLISEWWEGPNTKVYSSL